MFNICLLFVVVIFVLLISIDKSINIKIFKMSKAYSHELAVITARYMFQKKVSDLNEVSLSREFDKSGVLGLISLEYFKEFAYQLTMKIKTWWQRNHNEYRDTVFELLDIQPKNTPMDTNDDINDDFSDEISIGLDKKEWFRYYEQFNVVYGKRTSLSPRFDDVLNRKLLDMAVFCFLVRVWNWFAVGRKNSVVYWRGNYKCSQCNNRFVGTIKEDPQKSRSDNQCIMLFRYRGNLCTERTKLSSEDKRKLAIRLDAEGISNTRDKNILSKNQCKFL